jgi:hypothetical protein
LLSIPFPWQLVKAKEPEEIVTSGHTPLINTPDISAALLIAGDSLAKVFNEF